MRLMCRPRLSIRVRGIRQLLLIRVFGDRMTESTILEPYAIECRSGKYIVVQAHSQTRAITKVRDEYGQEPVSCRKLE